MKNRFVKIAPKTYQDSKSGLFIYELHDASTFGIAVWIVSKTQDGKEVEGVKGSTFNDCKQFLKENY